MRLTLKKMTQDQFKGNTHAEFYLDGMRVEVTGRNGSGKSTIYDGYNYVFADADSELHKKPKVFPDFLETSIPVCEITCDVDDTEYVIRKYQKDARTQKDIEDGKPVSIKNLYEINGLAMSETAFKNRLTDIGIELNKFLLLTYLDYFINQKDADCRNILFGMVENITDADIANMIEGCSDVANMLESRTLDEIKALSAQDQKKAKEHLDSITDTTFSELEKAKISISDDEFNIQKETLQTELDLMKKSLEDMDVQSIGDLNQELAMLDLEERKLTNDANAKRLEELSKMDLHIGELKNKLNKVKGDYDSQTIVLADTLGKKSRYEDEYKDLGEQFQAAKSREYDIGSGKCPTCGQNLPVHALDKAKQSFEAEKKRKMLDINREAKIVRDNIDKITNEVPELEKSLKEYLREIKSLEEEIHNEVKKREPLEVVIDVADTKECKAITSRRIEIKHAIAKADDMAAEIKEIRDNIRVREHTIREIEARIAEKERTNARIDKQIADLKEKRLEYADDERKAKRILEQVKKVSMKKSELLTDEVNKHFDIVKFELFEQMVNGEYKDVCNPMVRTEDGSYKKIGETANTALEIRGKLDIIAGLQKFYDQHLPVFVDGFEALDKKNAEMIQIDTQLITLSVIPDGDLTVKVVER